MSKRFVELWDRWVVPALVVLTALAMVALVLVEWLR